MKQKRRKINIKKRKSQTLEKEEVQSNKLIGMKSKIILTVEVKLQNKCQETIAICKTKNKQGQVLLYKITNRKENLNKKKKSVPLQSNPK